MRASFGTTRSWARPYVDDSADKKSTVREVRLHFIRTSMDQNRRPKSLRLRVSIPSVPLGPSQVFTAQTHRQEGRGRSTPHDLRRIDTARGIASVNDQLRFAHDGRVFVVGMICDDGHTIVRPNVVEGNALHLQIVMPAFEQYREIWVMVVNDRAPLLQQLDYGEGWRFAQIIDILLVGHTKYEH